MNARHTPDGVAPDSDADGLTDDEELEIGTMLDARDTDGDGIGDKVELLLSTVGLDPFSPNLPTVCEGIENPALTDTDGDGLTDCEEALPRLDATLFDSDADGIPDLLEFLNATNFLADDVLVDSDFDGVPNGVEIRAHSDPRSSDATSRAELSYLYRETDLGIRELHFATQPRSVSGVVVDDVTAGSDVGNGLLLFIQADPPILAWRDPGDIDPGPGVSITEDGTYTLKSSGDGVRSKRLTVTVTRALLPPVSTDEVLRVDIAERQCIQFRVRNVTLAATQAANGRPVGSNDVRIYFGQVPKDTPDAFGIFRVAQFQYRFIPPTTKSPDIADQPVETYRFVLFGD